MARIISEVNKKYSPEKSLFSAITIENMEAKIMEQLKNQTADKDVEQA